MIAILALLCKYSRKSSISNAATSRSNISLFFVVTPPPPSSTLFPYTTLFRSIPLDRRGPVGRRLPRAGRDDGRHRLDRKSTRLNSSHTVISYAVFCLKKKKHLTLTQKFSFGRAA